jgi:ATP-dependent RNA helicase DDX21
MTKVLILIAATLLCYANLLAFSFTFQNTAVSSGSKSSGFPLKAFGGARSSYSGGGGGGGGGGHRFGRQDTGGELRFKKTIKIDPELKTPIGEMNLLPKTLNVLQQKGFEFMTPVQSQSFEYVFGGEDVVARSRTGTGKTFAFGIPLIEKIVRSGSLERVGGLPLIVILEPTRELALQVTDELMSICSPHKMRVHTIFGGASFSDQERAIRAGVHILVATPGRLLDHISRGTVNLASVKHLVLDEGDTMLEMGFQQAVESIMLNVKTPGKQSRLAAQTTLDAADLKRGGVMSRPGRPSGMGLGSGYDAPAENPVSAAVQMLLFSATMPGWICGLTDKHMKDPVFLDAVQEGETRLADTIVHYSVRLLGGSKLNMQQAIENIVKTKAENGQTIVFTNTRHEADELVNSNCFGQRSAQALHGDISQGTRQKVIGAFKDGTIDVLVATDVAARGLDIAGVDLVIHAGPPNDADTYVHRSGRTGRAGRSGTAVMVHQSSDQRRLSGFERELNFRFLPMSNPTGEEVVEAGALGAAKRVKKVSAEVIPFFLESARELLAASSSSLLEEDDPELSGSPAEKVVAQCLAAMSDTYSLPTK